MNLFSKVKEIALSESPLRRILNSLNRSRLRRLVKLGYQLAHPILVMRAYSVAKKVELPTELKPNLKQLQRDGYTEVNFLDHELMQALVNEAEVKLHEFRTVEKNYDKNKKTFWNRLFEKDISFTDESTFVRLAASEKVLSLIAKYFGSAPYLNSIFLSYSVPTNEPLKISQLWHCDQDDVNVLKLFIYCNDVDTESGPFHFLPKQESKKVNYGFLMRHYQDDFIYSQVDKDKVKVMTGKKYSCFMVDTGCCFHMGSRITNPKKSRLMFTATYSGLPPVYTNFNNRITLTNTAPSDIYQLALSPGSIRNTQ